MAGCYIQSLKKCISKCNFGRQQTFPQASHFTAQTDIRAANTISGVNENVQDIL